LGVRQWRLAVWTKGFQTSEKNDEESHANGPRAGADDYRTGGSDIVSTKG
jgi:hypothetical protein